MESRVEDPNPICVPRDEAFEEAKYDMLTAGAQKALHHNIVSSLVTSMAPEVKEFGGFHEVDNLFKIGLQLKESIEDQFLKNLPDIISKDKFAWLRADEFARQTLAGINPVNIERLQDEMQNFTTLIVTKLKEEKLVATQGGPIILTQDRINDNLKKAKESEGESSYKSLTDNVEEVPLMSVMNLDEPVYKANSFV